MPNANRPRGLVPSRHLNGNPWNGQVNMYLVTDSNAMYVGDVVKHGGSSGAAGARVYGQDVEGMPTCVRITNGAADIPLGVVVGFLPLQPLADVNYKPADDVDRIALVCDDPTVVFEAQEDADTTPIAAASIGLNVALTTTAGSTTTGVSGMELDSSTVATTATLPVRILGLTKRVDNNLNTGGSGTDKAKFDVIFNLHHMRSTTGV